MSIFNKLKNVFGRTVVDESLKDQQADYDKFILRMSMAQDIARELGCDTIPGGQGKFGTLDNPVPVNAVIGGFVYLNRLRSRSGVAFMFHRLGSNTSSVTSHPVDIYSLVSVDAKEWYTIHLCPYYPRRSTQVPFGLSLVSWDALNGVDQWLYRYPTLGSNAFVPNFPYGLPDEIERNTNLTSALNSFSPETSTLVVNQLRSLLMAQKNWVKPSES